MGSKQNVTATDFKEQGNRYFAMRRYAEAIDSYSKAIVSDEV